MLREFDVWVVNASPLISLEKIGCLGLLARLAKEILLPSAVVAEVAAGPRPLLPAQLRWSGRRDLNPRRPPWQGGTLPLSYSREE
jgi:hypothetical protein